MIQKESKLKDTKQTKAGSVEIEVYTDPLCCWSWALEPQWRRLRYAYQGRLKWRYRMGGLIPNWDSFNDPMHAISRPLQMGPLWMEARHTSGMPIKDKVWFDNPPASSYPACIAVKAAELQSPVAAETYLRKVREAVMLHGQNIAEWQVLRQTGKELAQEHPEILDAAKFEEDLSGREARKAFEEDLLRVRLHNISRFPTFTMRLAGATAGVMIVGYRPYEALEKALKQVAPELEPIPHTTDELEYRRYWGSITNREVQEALRQG
ncbi:DsbA family oxidoreductase [Pontibacter flavimaris]|uniref:Disulfide bond formation protein DsbA n=1 Tax=Pontibacter flavimaris TaxID=1797110 RepID=A0A1Q5PEA0_9BACT|nr:DsbA family protein [Pontibacter flavimaris]OKL40491.1 disulfide bond formation protein DsbA [Pontibacter flavimaris]